MPGGDGSMAGPHLRTMETASGAGLRHSGHTAAPAGQNRFPSAGKEGAKRKKGAHMSQAPNSGPSLGGSGGSGAHLGLVLFDEGVGPVSILQLGQITVCHLWGR